jgi:hypothetical protein
MLTPGMRLHVRAACKKCHLNAAQFDTRLGEGGDMQSRIIIPTEEGERLSYDLRLHEAGGHDELKIVFTTSEEPFERWLFYLLRDIGAHIVTEDPERLRTALGLTRSERGIIAQENLVEPDVTRHFVKT